MAAIQPLNYRAFPDAWIVIRNIPTLRRYMLPKESPQSIIARIVHFISENSRLIPTFSITDSHPSRTFVKRSKYLVIHHNTVSLTDEEEAPEGASDRFIDHFTGSLIAERGYRCPQGHYFEFSRAQEWSIRNPDLCPFGRHPLGSFSLPIQIDLRDLLTYRERIQQTRKRLTQDYYVSPIQSGMLIAMKKDNEPPSLEQTSYPVTKRMVLSDTIVPCVNIVQIVFQRTLQELIKKGSKSLLVRISQRAIPIIGPAISSVTGVSTGAYRISRGEVWQGVVGIAAGCVSWIPIAGPVLSIGLDGTVLLSDLITCTKKNLQDSMTLGLALQYLGLDEKAPSHTREEVTEAYERNIHLIPSPSASHRSSERAQHSAQLQVLSRAREIVMQAESTTSPA